MMKRKKLLQGCGNYQVYNQIDGERPILWDAQAGGKGVLLENGTIQLHDTTTTEGQQLLYRHFLPQHFYLTELHADYPTAAYILPIRSSQEWAQSVMNWFQMRGRVINEYMYYNSSIQRPGKLRAKEFLIRIYEEHYDHVRRFVQQHQQQHALIEVNITDPQAGEILAAAFGLNASCWGHYNKVGNRANALKATTTTSTTAITNTTSK